MSNGSIITKNFGEFLIDEIFVYYDEPIVFSVSCNNVKYLCMLINNWPYKWLCCTTNDEELASFKSGLVDLRSLFDSKEQFIVIDDIGDSLVAIREIDKDYFPDAGFYLSKNGGAENDERRSVY